MSADTAELRLRMERVAAEVLERREKAEHAKKDPHWWLILLRNGSWFLALLFASIGAVLSYLYWSNKLHVANGVISWLSAGLAIYCLIGAVALQQTINQRKTSDADRRTNERMDLAAAKLREEIREARPADNEAIARLVAMQEATQALFHKVRKEISELMPLLREAYVAGLRDGRDGVEPDVGGGDVVNIDDARMLKRLDERLRQRPAEE